MLIKYLNAFCEKLILQLPSKKINFVSFYIQAYGIHNVITQ